MTGSRLVEFLTARLDEAAQVARAATTEYGPWESDDDDGQLVDCDGWYEVEAFPDRGGAVGIARCWPSSGAANAVHIARHDPARVLADIAAKRRIIELHTGDHECSTYDHNGEIDHCTWVIGDCSTLQLLALPDADHSDYDPSWAIE